MPDARTAPAFDDDDALEKAHQHNRTRRQGGITFSGQP
jgi:hypothetical protein